jgi:hypothetical protein
MAGCADCGTTDDVQPYGLCRPCNAERGRAERVAQGLAPDVTDPVVLDQIATLIRPTREEGNAA